MINTLLHCSSMPNWLAYPIAISSAIVIVIIAGLSLFSVYIHVKEYIEDSRDKKNAKYKNV